MKISILKLAAIVFTFVFTNNAWSAPQFSPIGKIIQIENGWFGEGIALKITGAGISGCSGGATQFSLDKNHVGYKEVVALALSAFASSANVQIVGDAGVCLFGGGTKVLSLRLIK